VTPSVTTSPSVLLFTDADVFAGTERHILELARSLSGLRVRVACPVPSPLASRAADAGIDVVPIPKRGAIDWRAILQLSRFLRAGDVDLIHAHNGRTALIATAAARRAGRGRVVVTQHFLAPSHVGRHGMGGWLSRKVHAWINRRVDRWIMISQAARRAALARGGVQESRLSVIPNGIAPIDADSLGPAEDVRRELGLAPNDPLLVTAARLEPEKDIATLVEAMQDVVRKHPTARCVIAGEGSLAASLRGSIKRYGLADSVCLLGFRSDVVSLIRAADVFVLPSLAEPFGLVLLEAMSLGRPVIATNAGGPVEIVDDGVTGLLVEPASPPQLADAIRRLLEQPRARQQMGTEGQHRFAQRFTAPRMAEATSAIYREMLGSTTAGESRAESLTAAISK
jgi:glycosyltransferase involved in cell wall biosynthesis